MKFGVVVFPGSNCERDIIDALRNDPSQAKELIIKLAQLAKELILIDRYERRALSRCKFAIRDFDAARCEVATRKEDTARSG